MRRSIKIGMLSTMLIFASPSVANNCRVQTTSVAFGNYDTLNPSQLNGTGSATVDCNVALPFTVGLGPGNGTINQRIMKSPTDALNYNLYIDASRTIIWGDVATGGVTGTGPVTTYIIYGKIPPLQNVTVGSYTDMIVVTVTY